MEDPIIRVDGDNGTLLNQSLWYMIKKMMFEDRLGWMYNGEVKMYLNGEKVEKPPEMEEEE